MKRYVVTITLSGDFEDIENNIDAILESIDPIFLNSADIVIRNEGEIEE